MRKLAVGGEQDQEESCEAQGLALIAAARVGQRQGCGWGAERKGPLLIRQWFGPQPGGCHRQFYWGLGIGEVLIQQSPPTKFASNQCRFANPHSALAKEQRLKPEAEADTGGSLELMKHDT